jgi:hypothetical protein
LIKVRLPPSADSTVTVNVAIDGLAGGNGGGGMVTWATAVGVGGA